jgi:hypothetical protein
MKHSLLCIALVLSFVTARGQEEVESGSSNEPGWSMFGLRRTWVPQQNNVGNWGISFQFLQPLRTPSWMYLGGTATFTGIGDRDAIMIMAGPGAFVVGDARLGLFTFVHTGLVLSAADGRTGFSPFDPTTTYTWGSDAAIGGSAELFGFIRLHLAAVASWYTVDGGRSPFGLQLGITSGGNRR